MRIRIIRMPPDREVDGFDLRHFQTDGLYDVGHLLGAWLLAEGYAEPLPDDGPAMLIPFSDSDPYLTRTVRRSEPPNLVRETHPPSVSEPFSLASDFERRRRPRTNS
jgi:hypothetical protein